MWDTQPPLSPISSSILTRTTRCAVRICFLAVSLVSLDPPFKLLWSHRHFSLEDGNTYIRQIEDNEDHLPIRHTKDFSLSSIPPSLIDAVRAFIVGRAIRLCRGHEQLALLYAGEHIALHGCTAPTARYGVHAAFRSTCNVPFECMGICPQRMRGQESRDQSTTRGLGTRVLPYTEFDWAPGTESPSP